MLTLTLLWLAAAPVELPLDRDARVLFDQSDRALHEQYLHTMASMRTRDSKAADHSVMTYQDALRHAQSAWLIFREEECFLEGSSFRDDPRRSAMALQCFNTLTQARMNQLEDEAR